MKKWILIIVVLFFVAVGAGSFFAIKTATRLLEEKRQNLLGLAVEIKSYYIDWLRARVILEGVALYPTGKVSPKNQLASAEKLIVVLSPRDIFKKKELHATKIVFEKPTVTYLRYSLKRKNWDALDLSPLSGEDEKEKKEKGKEDGFRVRIDNLLIKDGKATYRDFAHGGRLDLNDMDVEVSDIVYEPNIKKLPTKINMTAQVGDTSGKFKLKGKANLLAEGINFKADSTLSPMPVTYFSSFYRSQVPFAIRSGTLTVKSNARAVKSMLTSNHHVTITGLRVGGGMKADLINKFILSQNDRVYANAAVNGDLEKGDVSISHTASKVITEQLMAGAMKQTPVGQAGEAVKEGGKKIGDKVKGLFGH